LAGDESSVVLSVTQPAIDIAAASTGK